MLLLSHYNLIVYNGEYAKLPNFIQKGDIIELPFGKKLKKLRKKLKLTFNMIVSKSKKLSYRSFLSRKKNTDLCVDTLKYQKFLKNYLWV